MTPRNEELTHPAAVAFITSYFIVVWQDYRNGLRTYLGMRFFEVPFPKLLLSFIPSRWASTISYYRLPRLLKCLGAWILTISYYRLPRLLKTVTSIYSFEMGFKNFLLSSAEVIEMSWSMDFNNFLLSSAEVIEMPSSMDFRASIHVNGYFA